MLVRYLWVFAVLAACRLPLQASAPFSYQGRLEKDGKAVSDGDYSMRFALHSAAEEGDVLAGPVEQSVPVTSGLFTAILDFGEEVFSSDTPLWLQVEVKGPQEEIFTPLTPRTRVLPAPRAVSSGTVDDGAVTSSKLADGAVTSEKLAEGSVGTSAIQDFSVGVDQIADEVVLSLVPPGFMLASDSPASPPGYIYSGLSLTASQEIWTARANMITARWGAASAVVNGRIYVFGGVGSNGLPSSRCEEYDPAENSWRVLADMPTARYQLAGAAVGGKIYAIGGFNNVSALATVQVFDPETNTWSDAAPMPTARYGMGAVVVNGKIYVLGGAGGAWARNEMYDPVENTWTPKSSMSTQRQALAVAAIGSLVFTIGGNNGAIHSDLVEVYNTNTELWDMGPRISSARSSMAVVSSGGNIYLFGGRGSNIDYLATTEIYNVFTNTWTQGSPLATPRRDLTAAMVDGTALVIGGVGAGFIAQNKTERYAPARTLYFLRKN